uniref:Uncharacterized protein n=1 Tax=Siphoviridae sp. ct6rT12 TaxID=2825346 RepID=A0A8S5V9H4_9CAUD|nr:MAG TPA: hypothetical protein [Siphoviridae sp. ct6rT12]
MYYTTIIEKKKIFYVLFNTFVLYCIFKEVLRIC